MASTGDRDIVQESGVKNVKVIGFGNIFENGPIHLRKVSNAPIDCNVQQTVVPVKPKTSPPVAAKNLIQRSEPHLALKALSPTVDSQRPSGNTVKYLDLKFANRWIGCMECRIDGLRLFVKQGDITEEDVDVVVNSTNDLLDLNKGSVSRALKLKCGDDLANECQEKVTEMQTKGVCVTSAFNMKCRYILHLNSTRFHTDWQSGIKAILKEADCLGIRTIAFPALGTGGYNLTPEMSAEAMFRALIRFYKRDRDAELEVRVVLYNSDMIPPFVSQIEAQAASKKRKPTMHRMSNFFKGRSGAISLCDLITTINNLREEISGPERQGLTLLENQLADDKINQCTFTNLPVLIRMPTVWADQIPEEKVKRCPLLTSNEEYKSVEKCFRKSLKNTNIHIVNIERIQNPDLYTQYMIKKQQIETQNSDILEIPNERTLWHGTDSEAISSINQEGFSPNYCRKNGARYGNGVYFAVSAEYSTRSVYSPPDISGRRYVYQCKVLTGQATIGKVDMKVLPSRSGDILYDSATNNMDKPKLYVIFNDYQAYPEYLITFKDKNSTRLQKLSKIFVK